METLQAVQEQKTEEPGLASGPLAVIETVVLEVDRLTPIANGGCNHPGGQPAPCPAACGQAGHCVL